MNRLIGLVVAVTLSLAPSLRSQDLTKWEYGRLMTIWGVPAVWIVGTTVTQIDSTSAVLDRTLSAQREILRGNKPQHDSTALMPSTLLLKTMNLLGNDGWELVSIIVSPPIMPRVKGESNEASEMEYFFKRRKR